MYSIKIYCTAVIAIGSLVSAQLPTVDLGYVQVQGSTNAATGVNAFLGLKFAAAPTAALRWAAPLPIESSNEYFPTQLLNTTVQGAQCIQGQPLWLAGTYAVYGPSPSFGAALPSSEDCLLLDVFAPASRAQYLPVQIWIHGGGYNVGNAANAGGEQLVAHSNGSMVYVSIQYRLGAYGFLSSDAVEKHGTLNAGLLDVREAISWSNITISGGSAGGGAVTNQLILYGGEKNPPFRAAIPEYPWWQTFKESAIVNAQYQDLLAASGCTDLTCLRDLSEESLANATQITYQTGYDKDLYAYGDFYYGPVVDGDIIRDLPSNEFEKGHFSKVALLTDHDGFEGVVFSNFSATTAAETRRNLGRLWPSAGPAFWTRLAELYPIADFTGVYFSDSLFNSSLLTSFANRTGADIYVPEFGRAQTIYGDFIIDCPTYYIATAFANHNLTTYKLVFNSGNEVHGAVSAFLQSDPASTTNPAQSAQLQDYYISFVRTLDPNAETYSNLSRPFWPQYLQEDGTGFDVMEVNQTSIAMRADPDASPRCDFFRGQGYTVRN